MDFILPKKRDKWMISTLTRFAVNKIEKSIIYITIGVNTWVEKPHEVKVNV